MYPMGGRGKIRKKTKGARTVQISDFFPMWDKLTNSQKDILTRNATWKLVKKGTILHSGAGECVGLMLISAGLLRGYIQSEEGKEVTIYRLFPGDTCLFSASCIMQSIQFDIIISAEQDTQVWVIPPQVYLSLMNESVVVANYTRELMSARFSEAMWLMEQILFKSVDVRLAGFLRTEREVQNSLILTITHETIAGHMGTAREVVTRMLRYFQSEGMVRLTRGKVELVDVERIEALAGER